jgi:hypothetical protein
MGGVAGLGLGEGLEGFCLFGGFGRSLLDKGVIIEFIIESIIELSI